MAGAPHLLIVRAPYYEDITNELTQGAIHAVEAAGGTFDILDVPGAFEIPGAIAMAAQTASYDGYIALGCVIRGETSHYDYVCGECARAIQDLAVQHHLAVGFGVLTVENRGQADARAARNQKNKGGEAAGAALAMIGLRARFEIS